MLYTLWQTKQTLFFLVYNEMFLCILNKKNYEHLSIVAEETLYHTNVTYLFLEVVILVYFLLNLALSIFSGFQCWVAVSEN